MISVGSVIGLVFPYAICIGVMAGGFFVRRWWRVAVVAVLAMAFVHVCAWIVLPNFNPHSFRGYLLISFVHQSFLMLFYTGVGALLAVSLGRHRRPGRPTPAASDNPEGATT